MEKNSKDSLKSRINWEVLSIEKGQKSAISVNTKEEIEDLFSRSAFEGERIIVTSEEESFGIVPIEDLLLLYEKNM